MKKDLIDKDFIEMWAKKYNYTSRYNYSEILESVQKDVKNLQTISKETFEKIIRWKAERNVKNVNWLYFEIYIEAIADVLRLKGYKKICRLDGLPGILLPNASTILHFIYPQLFPIVDIRTVRCLLFLKWEVDGMEIHYLDPRYKIDYYRYHLYGYSKFKTAILEISELTNKTIREIDIALFSYDIANQLSTEFSENGILKSFLSNASSEIE